MKKPKNWIRVKDDKQLEKDYITGSGVIKAWRKTGEVDNNEKEVVIGYAKVANSRRGRNSYDYRLFEIVNGAHMNKRNAYSEKDARLKSYTSMKDWEVIFDNGLDVSKKSGVDITFKPKAESYFKDVIPRVKVNIRKVLEEVGIEDVIVVIQVSEVRYHNQGNAGLCQKYREGKYERQKFILTVYDYRAREYTSLLKTLAHEIAHIKYYNCQDSHCEEHEELTEFILTDLENFRKRKVLKA